MAAVVGEAGGSALRGALMRAVALPASLLLGLLVAAPFAVIGYSRTTHPTVFAITALVAFLIGFLISRRDLIDAYEMLLESRDWARGAEGERVASQDLALLPDEYLILNDVHPGFRGSNARWNWDHVIIGPKGIFVVDAKNYSAHRIRDGQRDSRTRRNVKQVRGYAQSFKRELVRLNPDLARVFVVPVLAYVNESTWVEQLQEDDVRVLPKRLLRNDILTGRGTVLPVGEAVKIANLLFAMYADHLQAEYRENFRAWATKIRKQPWTASPAPLAVDQPHAEIEPCPLCGAEMRLRTGSYGSFYGCSKYRESKCSGKRTRDGTPK